MQSSLSLPSIRALLSFRTRPPSHALNTYVTSKTTTMWCCTCASTLSFLAQCTSSPLSEKGLMADAWVDSRLGGLFVLPPTTTKRLKISCLFLGCLALGTVSHGGRKGYCLQDLHRPSFPSRARLRRLGETAMRRVTRREERRGGEGERG